MALLRYCTKLPKVELHAHLNGSISDKTLEKLIDDKKKSDPSWEPGEDWGVTIGKGQQRTLDDCFIIFRLLHQICTTEKHAYMVTCDVIEEFAADNVRYLELRTTPRDHPTSGMTKRSYVDSVIKGIQDTTRHLPHVMVRLLLAVDRRVALEEAEAVVDLALELKEQSHGLVVGVDLSGDPKAGDVRTFIPTLKRARQHGLKLALHLAESAASVAETEGLLAELVPDRLGHGTFLHPDVGGTQVLVDTVRRHNVPIEVCLTSNLKSGTVQTCREHHLAYWLRQGHPVAISTDDKGVFATSLSEEYRLAGEALGLGAARLWELSLAAVDHAFAPEDVKVRLKAEWERVKEDVMASAPL